MTYPRGFTPRQKQLLDRGRELAADREAERRAVEQIQRRNAVKKYRTELGDSVERFPNVEALRERVGDVREALVKAYEAAEQAEAVERRIGSNSPVDRGRFPALGGGDQ